MGGLFWIVVPSEVDPSKANPKTVALTGVCVGCTDVSAKLGTPPNIGGRFSDV
jgi:hypothetical protein